MNTALDPETIDFPADLPIVERREDIANAIEKHQVVIIVGETGSGKTTQLPKICLQLGRGERGRIGHTQPRRLAARTVAARIAQELGEEPRTWLDAQPAMASTATESQTARFAFISEFPFHEC